MAGTSSINAGGSLYLLRNTSSSAQNASGGQTVGGQTVGGQTVGGQTVGGQTGNSQVAGSSSSSSSTVAAGSTDRAALGADILASVLNSGITDAAAGTKNASSTSSIISEIKSGILTPETNALGMNSAIMKAYSIVSPQPTDTSSGRLSSITESSITKELTSADSGTDNKIADKNLPAAKLSTGSLDNSIESLTAAPAAAKSSFAVKTASQGGMSSLASTAKSNAAAMKTYSGLSNMSPGSILNIVA